MIQIQASAIYSADVPTLNIEVGGLSLESEFIDEMDGVGINIFTFSLPFTGSLPSSIDLRFNDGLSEGGRSIEISGVLINGQNITAQLSSTSLTNGNAASVDLTSLEAIFGQSEPDLGTYGPADITGTNGNDSGVGIDGDPLTDTGEVIDALNGIDFIKPFGGDDIVLAGAGDDRVFAGDGDDIVSGDTGDDFLRGDNGNDTLFGGVGNDKLYGNDGNDLIFGGDDDDQLFGHDGDDVLLGQDGNDRLTGGNGNDQMSGGDGDDVLLGQNGNDDLFGDSGSDILNGNDGNDRLFGGDDNDTLNGHIGDDELQGGAGNDLLKGLEGNDISFGGAGDDTIFDTEGDDVLNGDAGNDVLVGGAGADILNGGDGNDILHGNGIGIFDIYTTLQANPGMVFSAQTNSFYQLVASSVDWDSAKAAAESTLINGVAGHLANITSARENEIIYQLGLNNGASSTNRVWLGASDEAVDETWIWDSGLEAGLQFSQDNVATNGLYENWTGGEPDASANEIHAVMRFQGGGGDTWADVDNSETHYYVIEWDAGLMSDDNANDTIDGGAGNDFIYGYGGGDTLSGGADNDIIFGGNDDDTIDGGVGDDILLGESGDDTITGGDGADTIYGGSGDDDIDGGAGNDIIYGDDIPIIGTTIMEAGTTAVTQTSSTDWFTVNFSATIESAVVKMFAQDLDGDPFTIRVRNITDSGFEFQLDEYDYQDGITALETLSWLAVSEGTHTLADGTRVQAGFASATNENDTSVNFIDTSYSNPVVFSQLSSDNDLAAVVTRNHNVSTTGFTVRMQEEEASDGNHTTEDIGWIAFETGGSAATGILVGDTGDIVTQDTTAVNFGAGFGVAPVFLADMQILDGGDTAVAAGVSGLNAAGAQVYIDEEQSGDTEINHTTETVGYIALNSGVYTTTTGSGGSDVIRGGDGNDILYADSTVDTNITTVSDVNPLRTAINGENPIGYWPLDDLSGTTADNIGILDSTIDGTINGSATLQAGALYYGGDGSIEFDGVNDGIRIPDDNSINTSVLAAKTVELVFNADDVTTRQVLYEEGGTTHGLAMYIDGGNFYITGEHDGNWVNANFNVAISTSTTYHAAFVFDSADDRFEGFLNGVSIGSISVNGQDFPAHSADIGIAYAPDGVQFHDGESGSGGYNFDGRISDVAVYTTALDTSTIQEHASITQGNAPSGGPIDDTLYGGDGFDQFFAGAGRDVFVFEMASAFNDVDEINGFDQGEQDALDISDILTGFVEGTSDINDFVQVLDSGTDTLVQVDANGTAGGSSFTTIAQINDVTGLDTDTMYFNANFIV